jgi:arylformamidase
MRLMDITLTLSADLPVWPGDPQVRLERVRKIEEGANSNSSELQMRVHTGTHVDAPFHFLNDSDEGVDTLPLDVLIGFCCVVEIPSEVDVISRAVLESVYIPQTAQRVLFKTRNSKLWADEVREFDTKFVGIDATAAEYLVERGVKLVGIDYLSISPYKNSRPTHEVFLKNRVVVVEGLDLSKIGEGYYTIFCLPAKLKGSDGAPARVVLIDEE